MESSGTSATRSAVQPFTAMAIAFLAASLSGCASPGPARPPSLHLPRLVTDLTAARTGDEVTLRWTTPEKTTDALKVQSPLTASICREAVAHPATCTPVKNVPVHPGPSETSDRLPGALTAGPATLLLYRVQILNAHGHSAGQSSPAFAAAGAAPPPVEDLQVVPVRQGAMVQWQPQPASSVIDLDRIQVSAPVPKKSSTRKSPQLTPSTPVEVHLQAGKQTEDLGGTIDSTVQRGETYRYTAQRVRSISLDGHSLELRGVPSAPITIVVRDTFPPRVPTGLAAVPGSGSIDLSWEPNTDADLAGYIVYRQLVAPDGTLAGTPTRLTPTPIPAPAFSDLTAQEGQTYSYRVVAIDSSGNPSPSSAEARESLRKQ